MPQEPTAKEVEAVLRGWRAGFHYGMQIGRAALQNEFRNLMDCQPR